mgnify:CR=1 FL=1
MVTCFFNGLHALPPKAPPPPQPTQPNPPTQPTQPNLHTHFPPTQHPSRPTHRFLVFLAIYAGIVNNQGLPRFVRYHAMQAVLLDVLLM